MTPILEPFSVFAAELAAGTGGPAISPDWLWPGRIPLGSVTTLLGPRASGKTFVALDLAARVSTGAPWPDRPGEVRSPGSVIVISGDREQARRVYPRLAAAGADVDKVLSLSADRSKDDQSFQLAELETLEQSARGLTDLRLIVIDPFVEFVGETNDRRTLKLAELMKGLEELARRQSVAILLVNATDKGETGKFWQHAANVLPFLDHASDTVWAVESDPDDPNQRYFLPERLNLAPERGGLKFQIDHAAGRVAWSAEPIVLRSVGPQSTGRSTREVHRAFKWLHAFLSPGPRMAESVLCEAGAAGLSRRALYAAKERLSVTSTKQKDAFYGRWYWTLPGWDLGWPTGPGGDDGPPRPEPYEPPKTPPPTHVEGPAVPPSPGQAGPRAEPGERSEGQEDPRGPADSAQGPVATPRAEAGPHAGGVESPDPHPRESRPPRIVREDAEEFEDPGGNLPVAGVCDPGPASQRPATARTADRTLTRPATAVREDAEEFEDPGGNLRETSENRAPPDAGRAPGTNPRKAGEPGGVRWAWRPRERGPQAPGRKEGSFPQMGTDGHRSKIRSLPIRVHRCSSVEKSWGRSCTASGSGVRPDPRSPPRPVARVGIP
jgi:hypothetical protein